MNKTKRFGAALSAGLLSFSLAACAEDEEPDVIVDDEETTTAPAEPGDDTETEDTEGEMTEESEDMTEDSTE